MTKIEKIKNYLIKEINQNELMSKKHKKVRKVLNYIEHLLIVIFTITGCVFISAFASLVGISIGIMSSAIGVKICVITVGVKKYKSINKKKMKTHDKIVLLAKSILNSIEVLLSKALIDSNIGHDEFVLINNVLKEFYDMEEEIKNSNDKKTVFKTMLSHCLTCRKNTESKNPTFLNDTFIKMWSGDSKKAKLLKNKKLVDY